MNYARVPWWASTIFGVPGLIVIIVGWWFVATQHYRLATYLPARAHILQSDVKTHHSSKGGPTYEPVIRYAYTVRDSPYQGDRVAAMGNFSTSGDWAWRMCSQYPAGAAATVWYSPLDPANAFLSREPQFLPHLIAVFGIPFLSVGVWMLFLSVHGRRRPKPPKQGRDGWFELHEDGTIRRRFWFFTALTVAWYAYFAILIGDYLAVNQYHADLFCIIGAAVGGALGIIGLVQIWHCWQLLHDFLDAQVCVDHQQLQLGQPIQLRLRQGVRRPLQIRELALGAVCMRSDRIKTGNSVSYPPATEARSVWQKIEVSRTYPAGGEISVAGHFTLPHDADGSSPPRGSIYPIFRWFVVLRIEAENQPKLNVHFPIVVENRP